MDVPFPRRSTVNSIWNPDILSEEEEWEEEEEEEKEDC